MNMWLRRQGGFAHGVHPPPEKAATRAQPIRPFPFAPMLLLPLAQHAGAGAVPTVRVGAEVVRGQIVARADSEHAVPLHAPATGTVRRLDLMPAANGELVPGLFLETNPASTQEISDGTACELERATPEAIVHAVQAAGIVGLGGAAFPTHLKLAAHGRHSIDTLIVNGIECEPYLTGDHRLMLECADEIWTGVRYLLAATGAQRAVVAVESDKRDAAAALELARPESVTGRVAVLAAKYPQGAEAILVASVLGRSIAPGEYAAQVGVITLNVSTTAEIGRLLPRGRAILERVVTVSGPAIARPGNYRIPLGTPLRFVLEQVGASGQLARVLLGGPMMGQAVASLDVPVTKGVTGIVAHGPEHLAEQPEQACIRCGRCIAACPRWLDPSRLGRLARRGRHVEMRDQHRLLECFECGACAYVCPAHIPLVQLLRLAKAAARAPAR